MQKIDIFNHIFPEPFNKLMMQVAGDFKDIGQRVRGIPMLVDLDERFRVMDQFGPDYRQILSLASPPLEVLGVRRSRPNWLRLPTTGWLNWCSDTPIGFPASSLRFR